VAAVNNIYQKVGVYFCLAQGYYEIPEFGSCQIISNDRFKVLMETIDIENSGIPCNYLLEKISDASAQEKTSGARIVEKSNFHMYNPHFKMQVSKCE
jgi:hypothetical protein